ncbi:MAG: AbrB/MazE/SpoVT family DNA-binding domain-containing protein [Trueperaceae bacterium]
MANAVIETKLRAIGNSTGIVLPKEVLSELNLQQEDKVFLVKTNGGYIISAYDETFKEQMDAAREGMQKYRHALRELAK